jgi:hypothetical protein
MMLEEEKVLMEIGSYNRYKSVLRKLIIYDNEVTFMDINQSWIDKFRKYLRGLGNENTTVMETLVPLKVLGLAKKAGIKLSINIDEIKVKHKGNRTSLTIHELKRCAGYYFSEYISESPTRLILGYFI